MKTSLSYQDIVNKSLYPLEEADSPKRGSVIERIRSELDENG